MGTEKNKVQGDLNLGEKKCSASIETIKNKMDYYIGRYIHDKSDIRKVRDYYEGYRDKKQYAALESNFGIGNPNKVKLTPVIKSRIDIITGIMSSQDLESQVFTIDKDTISKEMEEELGFVREATDKLLDNLVEQNLSKEEQDEKIKSTAEKIKSDTDFISTFQKAAQDIINLYMENTDVNLDLFKEMFFRNILLDGEAIFKEKKIIKGEYPGLEICMSEDTFFKKTKGSRDIGTSASIVNRRYMTKQDVLLELGEFMDKSQKTDFLSDKTIPDAITSKMSGRATGLNIYTNDPKQYATFFGDDDIYDDYYQYMGDVVEVVHVEYKETKEVTIDPITFEETLDVLLGKRKKEKKFIEYRYSGYRVGNYYYLNVGLDKDAKRNVLNPSKVQFTYHGTSFNEFNKRPVSIGYALIDTQDMIDVTKFHRDNLLANSGVNGSRMNVAAIPHFLGVDMMERVMAWVALSKQGKELIDPTLPGAGTFQHYGDFKNSVDGNALMAINAVIQGLDADADLIAGTNPNMRGITEQREAVSNVKTGITMVSYSNKHYYAELDNNISKALSILLDNTKISFPNGFSGSYYKGANKIVFNHLPEKYLPSQFIVSIKRDDTDVIELQKMKADMSELAKMGVITPEALILIRSSRSIYEAQALSVKYIKEKKDADDIKGKMQAQLKEYEGTLKEQEGLINEMQGKIEEFTKKNLDLEQRKVSIKETEVKAKITLEQDKLSATKSKDKAELEEIQERTQLEREQLHMETGNSKEVKNLKI